MYSIIREQLSLPNFDMSAQHCFLVEQSCCKITTKMR